MRRAGKHIVAISSLILCGCVTYSLAGDSWKYLGDYLADDVYVIVESGGGFGGQLHRAGLSGSGKFTLVGAYSDTTAVRSVVPSEQALGLIDALLAVDFMGQPEVYRGVKGQARMNADGRLQLTHTDVIDGDYFKIALHIGSKSHTVTLRLPAYGAPESLMDWMNRFRELVKEQASWVTF